MPKVRPFGYFIEKFKEKQTLKKRRKIPKKPKPKRPVGRPRTKGSAMDPGVVYNLCCNVTGMSRLVIEMDTKILDKQLKMEVNSARTVICLALHRFCNMYAGQIWKFNPNIKQIKNHIKRGKQWKKGLETPRYRPALVWIEEVFDTCEAIWKMELDSLLESYRRSLKG